MKEILSMKQVASLLKGFTLFLMVTTLLACSSDSDNPPPPDPDPQPSPSPEPNPGPDPVVDDSKGNRDVSEALKKGSSWQTQCLPTKSDGGLINTLSFTLTEFTFDVDFYSDSTCTKKDKSDGYSSDYEVGSSPVTSPEGYKGYEIDLIFRDGSLFSLVALNENQDKILMTIPKEDRPSDFSSALEYSNNGKGIDENGDLSSKDLEGTWNSVCAKIEEGKSVGIVFDVKGDQFNWHQFIFSDDACEKEERKDKFPGATIIGKEITTDDGKTARELDLKYDDSALEKRIYAKDKTDSGRDVLLLSLHDKGTGDRPTSLNGLVFGKHDADDKSTTRSNPNAPDFMRNNEELDYFSTSDVSLELKQKDTRAAGISIDTSKDFSQKLQELQELLPNPEAFRSGNW